MGVSLQLVLKFFYVATFYLFNNNNPNSNDNPNSNNSNNINNNNTIIIYKRYIGSYGRELLALRTSLATLRGPSSLVLGETHEVVLWLLVTRLFFKDPDLEEPTDRGQVDFAADVGILNGLHQVGWRQSVKAYNLIILLGRHVGSIVNSFFFYKCWHSLC